MQDNAATILEVPEIPVESNAPAGRGSRRRKSGFAKLLGVSGITMAMALPIGIYPRLMQSKELSETQNQSIVKVPAVSTVQVKPASNTHELTLPGTIEAIVETAIYARTDGYIRERRADIGDKVTAGQLLASIETPEKDESAKEARAQVFTNVASKAQSEASLDRAKADLDKAVAELAAAKSALVQAQSDQTLALATYQRWKALVEQGAVSAQDTDEKETRYKVTTALTRAAEDKVRAAQSEVVAAKARIKVELANVQVNEANIDAARARENRSESMKSFQNVVAPFSGVITERNIDQGSLVTEGSENSKSALYRLARIDTLKVFVDVPQYASTGVKAGQKVDVSLKEYPNRLFSGTIARTAVALDRATRTLRTEIHIPNQNLILAPGMYADVKFVVPRTAQMLLVPSNAVLIRAGVPQVAVASQSKVHFRKVSLGNDLGKEQEIISGITSGESVIVNPKDSLEENQQVAVEK